MKKIFLIIITTLFASGCATIQEETFYENGQRKSYKKREGFISWSDGDGKTLNMPLANPSINGMGIGK